MKSKMKRFWLLFMSALMVLNAVPFVAFADTSDEEYEIPKVYYLDDDNSYVRLVLGKTEEVKIGKSATISVTIKNMSDDDWKKTKVRIAPIENYKNHYLEDDDEEDDSSDLMSEGNVYPFEITDSLNEYHNIGAIKAGGKKTANFKVSMKKNLKEGYYPVLIQIMPEDGGIFDKTMYIWAKTPTSTDNDDEEEDTVEAVAFSLGEGQATPQGIYGEVMKFGINMRNTGYKTAYDVRVEMGISEDKKKFPFEINDANYDRWLGDIKSNETKEITYSMAIQEDVPSGYYPIPYSIKYREEENGAFAEVVEKIVYVRIIGEEEEDSISEDAGENERTKARIIVDKFETVPEKILAGEDFTLNITMKNASSQISASNILFTFDPESVSDSPVFTTVNGSNSVVVNSLAPGASETLTMNFTSSPSAEQRSYTVTITEQYDSPEFKNAKESVKIAIPLKQEARVNVGSIEIMPNAINVGDETNIMFTVNNTGKVTLYNVTAIFEADSIQRSETYVGNIKPGESGSVDTMVLGTAATMDEGMIGLTISYEDENGSVSTVEKEIQLFVSEQMPMDDLFMEDDMGMDLEEPEMTKRDIVKKYAIPLGAAAVIVLGAIVFVIRRKKKKAGMDDEIL